LVRSFDPILTQDPTVVVSTGGSWNLADDDPFEEVTVVWCGRVVGGLVFAAVRRRTCQLYRFLNHARTV
jgi:hypothetical protein